MDPGAWWATVYGVAKSQTRLKRLSMHSLCVSCPTWGMSSFLRFLEVSGLSHNLSAWS